VSKAIIVGTVVIGLGRGIIGARLRRIINKTSKESNSKVLLRNRYRTISRD
jgi:hypothetical protein